MYFHLIQKLKKKEKEKKKKKSETDRDCVCGSKAAKGNTFFAAPFSGRKPEDQLACLPSYSLSLSASVSVSVSVSVSLFRHSEHTRRTMSLQTSVGKVAQARQGALVLRSRDRRSARGGRGLSSTSRRRNKQQRRGVSAKGVTDTVDQLAFLDLVTVDSVKDAAEVFARWGIVRVRNHLSEDEVESLLQGAKQHGIRRTAFAQDSQIDRYTLWIAGDGMSAQEQEATKAMQTHVPCLERAIFHDHEESWRPIADKFGYPNLMLAEIVTAGPNGAPQDWHFDGDGITAQVSLIPIGEMNGPTEIQPRPTPKSYMKWMNRLQEMPPSTSSDSDDLAGGLQEMVSEVKMLYDRLTKAHEFAWNTLRPILGDNTAVARALIESGLTPPVVHLTADPGTLTLYDASMIHRGGHNRSPEERPILAVHINKENKADRQKRRQEELGGAVGQIMKQKKTSAGTSGGASAERVLKKNVVMKKAKKSKKEKATVSFERARAKSKQQAKASKATKGGGFG